jgi:hypothetical protein
MIGMSRDEVEMEGDEEDSAAQCVTGEIGL